MTDRKKVITGVDICLSRFHCGEDCPYYNAENRSGCMELLRKDALELLKERENHVSVPFTWLVKFCTHINFREPMSDEERAERWKEKLNQQFGVKFDGMKVKWDS